MELTCSGARLPKGLVVARTATQIEGARAIFRDYAASLPVSLDFQHFDAELDGLPGAYAEPAGLLLLAMVDGAVAGCVAMRALPDVDEPDACEMKRLFVRPPYRGLGLGRILVQALVAHAREAGHSAMYLDTLDDMEVARELYASIGFVEVPPFYFNPLPGAHYLRIDLEHGRQRY
jgi:putative acetyltransferase